MYLIFVFSSCLLAWRPPFSVQRVYVYVAPSESVWERRFNGDQKKKKLFIIIVKLVRLLAVLESVTNILSQDLTGFLIVSHRIGVGRPRMMVASL